MQYTVGYIFKDERRLVQLTEVDGDNNLTGAVEESEQIEVEGTLTTTETGQVLYVKKNDGPGPENDDEVPEGAPGK